MSTFARASFLAAFLGGLALPALAQDAPAPATPATPPTISINGTPVTPDELAIAYEDVGATLPKELQGPQRQQYIIDYSIDLNLAAAEADKTGIVDKAALEARLAYYRKKVVMDQLLTKAGKDAVTEPAMKALYDSEIAKMKPEEEVRASHILVPTEDEAKKVVERLKAGEDFATVAKSESKDPGSADGGDLGWFTKERMVPEFSAAAFALKPGEISAPVKSQFGWHVIKLVERRTQPLPTFDQVKPQIAAFLTRKAQQELVLKLRSAATIVRPQVEAPAAPAPAPAPAEAPKQ